MHNASKLGLKVPVEVALQDWSNSNIINMDILGCVYSVTICITYQSIKDCNIFMS